MNIVDAIILGVVQGLTEFLPVSSSGHLVIFKNLLNIDSPGIVMEIALHFGTMIAICAVFRKDIYLIIKDIIRSIVKLAAKRRFADVLKEDKNTKLFLMIMLGTVPTVIIALLFEKMFESFFSIPFLSGIMLIVTGTVLWFTKMINLKDLKKDTIPFYYALIIGVVQGIAIMPGISRSGTTIAAATFLGIKRELAAKFSFLLSIPVILGGTVLKIGEMKESSINFQSIIIGTIIATLVGYLSLLFLVNLIKKGRFYLFAYYCWGAGIISVIYFTL
ncbi:MAG: undecaprenyl-diphosphate phosphatase [Candidatus Anammoxibacter sp.]